MPIKFVKLYTREYIRANPEWLFVFGDNYQKKGLGGQAKAARGEPNALGLSTKKAPDNLPASYLTNEDYTDWLYVALGETVPIVQALQAGKTVVFPEDGLGTGLARLPEKAPRIATTINESIGAWVERYGMVK